MENIASPVAAKTSLEPEAPLASRRDLLALFAALSLLALGLGGWLTSLGFGPWYDELKKPWFQPPGWVFTPAWTLIFSLLAVATWQVARRGDWAQRGSGTRLALWLYGVQLVLNVAWSLCFFTLHNPTWALIDIFVLDAVVVAMVVAYGRVHRTAGWLLVPYAVWLGLATAINVWVVANN
ncbi:MAG: TspO/MBR family protein [Acidobacteriota bacterium]